MEVVHHQLLPWAQLVPVQRPEGVQEEIAAAVGLYHEEALAEQAFGEPLPLDVELYVVGAGEVGGLLDDEALARLDLEGLDVSDGSRAQRQLARSPGCDEVVHEEGLPSQDGQPYGAQEAPLPHPGLDLYVRRHVGHSPRLPHDALPRLQVNDQHRVGGLILDLVLHVEEKV